MYTYRYKHGDRPLDGYTIQRAAGRGGFGEVYYAVSDAGREVALKVLTGYEQIELRGITQCMNLKSPHLVSIFDVRTNAQGQNFVIMEYVNGPSLRALLDESPAGLGEQKAAFFLREIAKGLTYLHDCGIVHRDLKPGNIFFEDGLVKIGDYGLSKAIASNVSQREQQTVTVGTVHYMAPEVGLGNYDRSIDIYAMGALLFELLTGVPPFVGSTPTEVLMKHIQAEPDLRNVPEPFATVVRRAMAKDPAQRFHSVQEMVEAVFGASHVRETVSVFSPTDLSMVAGRVARHVAAGAGSGGNSGGFTPSSVTLPPMTPPPIPTDPARGASNAQPAGGRGDVWQAVASWTDHVANQIAAGVQGKQGAGNLFDGAQVSDPLQQRHRSVFAGMAVVLAAIVSAVMFDQKNGPAVAALVFTLIASVTAGLGVIAFTRLLAPRMQSESPVLRKIFGGGMAGLAVAIVTLPAWIGVPALRSTLLATAIPLFFFDLRRWTRPDREDRLTWETGMFLAIWGVAAASFFGGSRSTTIASLLGTLGVAQLLSPWDPTLSRRRQDAVARGEISDSTYPALAGYGAIVDDSKYPQQAQQPAQVVDSAQPAAAIPGYAPPAPGMPRVLGPNEIAIAAPKLPEPGSERTVPALVRVGWVPAGCVALSVGIGLLVRAGKDGTDEPQLIAAGVAGCVASALCLFQSLRSRNRGFWSYLGRPVLMWACASTIVLMGVLIGYDRAPVHVAVPVILLCGIALLTAPFLSRGCCGESQRYETRLSPLYRGWAVGLAGLQFVGIAGIHRFYAGRTGSGILYLLTFGLAGVGTLVDVIRLMTGRFTDAQGRPLARWGRTDHARYVLVDDAGVPLDVGPANWSGGSSVGPGASAYFGAGDAPTVHPDAGYSEAFPKPAQIDRPLHPAGAAVPAPPAAPAPIGPVPPVPTASPAGELAAGRRTVTLTAAIGSGSTAARSDRRRRRQYRRSQGGHLAGLLGAVASLLILLGIVLGVAAAVDAPGMVAAGLPTPEVRERLDEVFLHSLSTDGRIPLPGRSKAGGDVTGVGPAIAPPLPAEATPGQPRAAADLVEPPAPPMPPLAGAPGQPSPTHAARPAEAPKTQQADRGGAAQPQGGQAVRGVQAAAPAREPQADPLQQPGVMQLNDGRLLVIGPNRTFTLITLPDGKSGGGVSNRLQWQQLQLADVAQFGDVGVLGSVATMLRAAEPMFPSGQKLLQDMKLPSFPFASPAAGSGTPAVPEVQPVPDNATPQERARILQLNADRWRQAADEARKAAAQAQQLYEDARRRAIEVAERNRSRQDRSRVEIATRTASGDGALIRVEGDLTELGVTPRVWVRIFRGGLIGASAILFLAGTALLTFARRGAGQFHMLRGAFGVGLIVGSLVTLQQVTHASLNWSAPGDTITQMQAVEMASAAFSSPTMIPPAVTFFLAAVLLAWPRRAERTIEDFEPARDAAGAA
jgi:hypothetical protein